MLWLRDPDPRRTSPVDFPGIAGWTLSMGETVGMPVGLGRREMREASKEERFEVRKALQMHAMPRFARHMSFFAPLRARLVVMLPGTRTDRRAANYSCLICDVKGQNSDLEFISKAQL